MNLILIEIKNVFYVFNMVLSMKVLRIKALGIPFFKEELNISFFGKRRTFEDAKNMYKISSNINELCSDIYW